MAWGSTVGKLISAKGWNRPEIVEADADLVFVNTLSTSEW